jgi:small subunit ribosomal protein S7
MIYNNKYILISFIKILQKNGKKELSELTLKNTFSVLKKLNKLNPLFIFKEAVYRSKPFCEVKSIRISGTNYKVPVEIKLKRQISLVFKWLIINALNKSDLPLPLNLAKELIDTYNLNSKTIKMCDDFHKMAESNKIYVQFRN